MEKVFTWSSIIIIVLLVINPVTIEARGRSKGEIKAYRNINFGESQEEVAEKVKEDPELNFSKSNEVLNWVSCLVDIGSITFRAKFEFYKNQLYCVRFLSMSPTSSNFEKAKEYRDELVDIISSKYGSPSAKRELSVFSVVEQGKTSHIWGAEDLDLQKDIMIGIMPIETGYSTILAIFYPTLFEEKLEEEKEEEKRSKQKSSEDF